MIALRRETNPEWLNFVCNHPKVRPTVGGPDEPIDLGPLLSDLRNVALRGENGAVIFNLLQPGLYEMHLQVLPRGRGAWTLDLIYSGLHLMFCGSDMVEVVTRVPDGHIAARAAVRATARILPITREMHRANSWTQGDEVRGSTVYSLRIQDWMRTAPALIDAGHVFHKLTEEAYARAGRDLVEAPGHREDEDHARYAGAAYEMVRMGQPFKAAVLYNRWAAMAGFPPILVKTLDPLDIDMGDCEIRVTGDTFDLLPTH